MKFGEKLKDLRQKRKLTQDEVAKSIGVSRRAYIAYEQENVRPRKQETYNKLAKTLGCNVNYLRIDDTAFDSRSLAILRELSLPLWLLPFPPFMYATTISAYENLLERKAKSKKKLERSEEIKEPLTYTNDMLFQYEKTQKKFAAIARGILYKAAAEKGIQCQPGKYEDADGLGIPPDDYIIVNNQDIESWWLIFWAKDPKLDKHVIISPDDRAGVMINRFTTAKRDPKRMATIVVDDNELYEAVCKYKEHNSYRGNLSVVLVDTNEITIRKEEIISLYDDAHPVESTYISVL